MSNPQESLSQGTNPIFSILILCWNSQPYIHKCISSLNNQSFKNFEIVIIENGSSEPIKESEFIKYPDLNIRFYPLMKNIGFAGGNNLGATLAQGQFLVLLNSDAFPTPDWLENIRAAIERYPGCFFASKQLMANSPECLDGEGDVYHISGLVWRRSYNRPASQSISAEGEVFSACAAAGVYPKDAFDLVGGFDTDYFAYVEDVDLGFRLRLMGYKCIYLPSAVVYHVGTASTGLKSEFSIYYGHRNLVWTFVKNMPTVLLVLLLPLHLATNLGLLINAIFNKRFRILFRAKIDALKSMRDVLRKRKKIQKNRKVSSFELFSAMDTNPLSPLALYFRRKD